MFAGLHNLLPRLLLSHGRDANHQDSPIYDILLRIDQHCRTINLTRGN